MPLTDIINTLESVKRFDIIKETANIINSNGDYISGLLLNQFREGKDGDGEVFKLIRNGGVFDYYSDRTVFEKGRKGQPYDRITYYDSGVFYTSIYVYASGDSFIFDSDVPYFPDILLHAASGEKIMELSKNNLELFKDQILIPQLQQAFNLFVNV